MSLEKLARFKPGENITVRPAGATALLAGRFVQVTAIGTDRCYKAEHASAGDAHPFGVTQRSSADPTKEDEASADLLVETVRSNAVARVEAGEAIVSPTDVAVGANGKAVNAHAAVAAALTTGTVGENNGIVWTAKTPGVAGNGISIELLNTGKEKTLSVDVDGPKIVVTLATNGTGAGEITSTAALVMAAIEEHDTASQMVAVASKGASNGTGKVLAVPTTNLTGGSEATGGGVAVGKALTPAAEAGKFIEVSLY